MSGVSSWLQRMKKADVVSLAESVGLEDVASMRKTDLEIELNEFLTKNASKYRDDERFGPFYRRRSESSPVKKELNALAEEAGATLRSVKRRVTKAAEELVPAASDESESDQPATVAVKRAKAVVARTPRAVSGVASGIQNYASTVPLPPSPAVVADAIDRRTVAIRSKLSEVYQESGFIEKAQEARETFSSVVTVQALIVIFELFNLRKEILADRYAFTIPAIKLLGTSDYPVNIPDLFLLLTGSFWNPAILWAFTSLFIPLTISYFINLTHKPARGRGHISHFNYEFDPLAFNIAKAVLVYVVFGQDKTFGFIDLESVARINSAIYGGYKGVLTGTAIGGLATLYEAIVKK